MRRTSETRSPSTRSVRKRTRSHSCAHDTRSAIIHATCSKCVKLGFVIKNNGRALVPKCLNRQASSEDEDALDRLKKCLVRLVRRIAKVLLKCSNTPTHTGDYDEKQISHFNLLVERLKWVRLSVWFHLKAVSRKAIQDRLNFQMRTGFSRLSR